MQIQIIPKSSDGDGGLRPPDELCSAQMWPKADSMIAAAWHVLKRCCVPKLPKIDDKAKQERALCWMNSTLIFLQNDVSFLCHVKVITLKP